MLRAVVYFFSKLLLAIFVIIIDTKRLKKQRDRFKENIIKLPNYYQNEYYTIKLCIKNF